MLSNLIVTNQRLVIIKDDDQKLPFERFFDKFVRMWLREQGKGNHVLDLTSTKALSIKDLSTAITSRKPAEPFTVILPSLTKLVQIDNPRNIIQFVHSLKKNYSIRQIYLLCTSHLIPQELAFLPAFLEHMSKVVVTFSVESKLTILSRQSGGSVSRKNYSYQVDKKEMLVTQLKALEIKKEEEAKPVEHPFKIELEEEEMLARNAIKLPYERTSEADIFYTPDEDDDFDEEDPDEDLYI